MVHAREDEMMMQERPMPPDDQPDPNEPMPADPADEEVTDDEHERPSIEPDDATPTEDPGVSPI